MPDPNKTPEDILDRDEAPEIDLFDPWEQRFKFEPRSRLHGHVIESDGDSGTAH